MIDIALMGPTRIRVGGRWMTLRGVKPRRLLEMVAVAPGTPVSKDALAEGLWDGLPPVSYVACVESYACAVRRSLVDPAGPSALVTTQGGYLLDPSEVRVDLVEVRRLVDSVLLRSGEDLLAGAEEVVQGTKKRLLADEPFAPFAEDVRAGLDHEMQGLLVLAAEHALGLGQSRRALRLGLAAMDRGRLSEPACRAVMAAYRAQGARAQALTVYADLRAEMLDALGVEPCESTRNLYLEILDDSGRIHPHERDSVEVSALARLLQETLEAGAAMDPANWAWLNELRVASASRV